MKVCFWRSCAILRGEWELIVGLQCNRLGYGCERVGEFE